MKPILRTTDFVYFVYPNKDSHNAYVPALDEYVIPIAGTYIVNGVEFKFYAGDRLDTPTYLFKISPL